jgi:hypothetical protein
VSRAAAGVRDPAPLPLRAKAALVLEVAASYLDARRSLRGVPLGDAVAHLRAVRRDRGPEHPDAVTTGRRLGRAVVRTLPFLPGDTRCLTQSLTLTRLLARRGIESKLVIGVRAGESFAAHAWVEHEGVPLLPAGGEPFERLVTL